MNKYTIWECLLVSFIVLHIAVWFTMLSMYLVLSFTYLQWLAIDFAKVRLIEGIILIAVLLLTVFFFVDQSD